MTTRQGYQVAVRLQGVAPILFSRFTEGSVQSIRTGATGGKFTDDERTLEALEKVYVNEAGGLYVPGWNVKKCLLDGCKMGNHKEGKKSFGQYVAATVFVDGNPVFDGKMEPDFIHEVTGKRPPRTGGAVLIKRPAFNDGWELPFTLNVVDPRRDAATLRAALEDAGLLAGLGSWRPEYGRFIVTEWEIIRAETLART
jgi:hypothetical protein